MDALIQVQELYKSYQRDTLEIPVLRNINLKILEGEFVAFMVTGLEHLTSLPH